MKHSIILTIILTLGILQVHAQEISIQSKVTAVEVYRTMAKETRTASTQVKEGYNEIVLSGVTTSMNDLSLQVSVQGDAQLQQAAVRNNFLTPEGSSLFDTKEVAFRDSMRKLDHELRWLNEERLLATGEINLVNELLKVSNSKENYTPDQLNNLADMYRTRHTELRKKLFEISLQEETANVKKTAYQNQLNSLGSQNNTPIKEIILTFYAEKNETLKIECNYLVASAHWIPTYDIHAENTTTPLHLTYKAKINQTTGFDWKDVSVSVSTTNPGVNNNRPMMSPKYIDYVTYSVQPDYSGVATNVMQVNVINNDYLTPEVAAIPTVDPAEADIQLEFSVKGKHTIAGYGKEYICTLNAIEMPASYKYHVVPKIDPTAFLIARITDYGKYNLLRGDANIFFSDTYVGKVDFNPHVVADSMMISMGRDESIVVKRIRKGNKTSKKIVPDLIRDSYTWEIVVRNNKSTPIEIEILDQVPLSRRKEITVKLNDKGGATHTPDFGKLLWTKKIKPNESSHVEFSYTIEYPDKKSVKEY
ncbi:MAG: DUF4139 domain-containing protein [Flavobacteriales bacterium]|nr:DUF4139 domain-containing protein [Flavobacteriales bacterium]